jgi:spore coat polysaccharide biosynthesis protein SpsF
MKRVIIVQARTGSTRLPGKVLMPLAGRPLLEQMLRRLEGVRLASEIVVATTVDDEDEPIRQLCRQIGARCHSGHPTDLLDRHYQAAREAQADVALKIPSDCPLIDPAVVDLVLGHYIDHESDYDFVSNLHPPTWPDGQDVEVIPMPVLKTAWREAEREIEREHTTPFIWEQPQRFRIGNVVMPSGEDLSMQYRLTIDYQADYELISAVYDRLYSEQNPFFSVEQIIELLDGDPQIAALNQQYNGVNWYRNHLDELKTIDRSMTREERADN